MNLSPELRRQIFDLAQSDPAISDRAIAKQLGVSRDAAAKYRNVVVLEGAAEDGGAIIDGIKFILRRTPTSETELADALDCSPKQVRRAIEEAMARGGLFMQTVDGKYDLKPTVLSQPGNTEVIGSKEEWTHVFGVTSDNHLCNKHSRLDVLNAAYDHFEREGITRVFNCGNWIDGEARFNKAELVTAPGLDNQLDYMIDKWPTKKNIVTEFVAGDDHEGWYAQRECLEVGRYLQYRAEDQGRQDLKYLGYGEADVKLVHPAGGSVVMRVIHAGGGSSYATSYAAQKIVEMYQGGEKPAILLIGHYHKFEYGYPREVHAVQCGCTTDQSLFMRKNKIAAHVGYVIIRIKQEPGTGIVTRFNVEWSPFYDRKFYEKRF